jgi:hypothetical protein
MPAAGRLLSGREVQDATVSTARVLVDFDLTVAKKMKLTERFGAELRVECYNIFNHPHFGTPDNTVGDPTFGEILSTVSRSDGTTSARQLQVALKMSF